MTADSDRGEAGTSVEAARATAMNGQSDGAGVDGWSIVSRLSHTFRTPLNHVLGFAEILDNQSFGPLNDRQAKYVKKIQAAGRRQLRLLDQLVDISRVETGELTTRNSEWDIDAAIADAVHSNTLAAAERQIEFVVRAAVQQRVTGDFDRFSQILDTLLAYGVKRSSPGDVIDIEVSCSAPPYRETDVGDDRSVAIHVTVADAGGPPPYREIELLEGQRGIDQNQLGDVEGLGLIHAHAISVILGGGLSVRRERSDGLTVDLRVPFTLLTSVT